MVSRGKKILADEDANIHELFKVLLVVMVVGVNPFENVVKAEECNFIIPDTPLLSQVNLIDQS